MIALGPKLGKLVNCLTGDNYADAFRPFLRAMDALIMGSVLQTTLNVPPVAPANGDAYIVAIGASSAWVGQDNSLAVYSTEITLPGVDTKAPGWDFYSPKEGWSVWDVSTNQPVRFSGGVWNRSNLTGNFVDEIVPLPTGDPKVFILPSAPNPASSLLLINGGVFQHQGPDYTLAGVTISYVVAPAADNAHICFYRT